MKVRPKSASVEEPICYNRYMPRYFYKKWKDPQYNSAHYMDNESKVEAIIDRILLKLRFAIWNIFRK